ncbi:MAG: BON domain-containing protein [Fluviicola sp.]
MKTDSDLQKDVMNELKWESSINKASEIGVSAKDGVISLSGSVENYSQKQAAEKAALRVDGVKAVAEGIDVKLMIANKRTDAEIAQASVGALKWNNSVPDNAVKVKVEDGWVTAEGKVDWAFQKSAVNSALAHLVGVTGVNNFVTINPKVNPVDVQQQITAAFERIATIDSKNITVENIGNGVVLAGTVRSYTEKNDAEHAAWNAPGVSAVQNNIEVKVPAYSSI